MTTYQTPPDATPFTQANKVAKAIRLIARSTDLPPDRCIAMIEKSRNTQIADLPAGDPQWRNVVGRRACRHIMTGLEPAHWQGPEFSAFRSVLELITLTQIAKPEQLWKAATALLEKAGKGESLSGMETKIAANGLTDSSHSWTLNGLRDNPERDKIILESANMAIDAWPAYYRSPHPDRLKLVQDTAGKQLSEMQCEFVCATAMLEDDQSSA